MRTRQHSLDRAFLAKIAVIRDMFTQDDPGFAAVILIGINESEPVTILDGNHRLTTAMLTSPQLLRRLRYVCGLSPRMTECCWYNTNIGTLLRYARNLVTHARRNPEAELEHLLDAQGPFPQQRTAA